jgi:uroporphyrinogen decarboxylase
MMGSRERVLAAIGRSGSSLPDRVPVDLGGMRSTGIMAIAYANLKEHLNISTGAIQIYDITQQLAQIEPEILSHFSCDVVPLDGALLGGWQDHALPDGRAAKICAGVQFEPDGNGGEYLLYGDGSRGHHRPASSYYFDSVPTLTPRVASIRDLDTQTWPLLPPQFLTELRAEAKRLSEETDYAIMGGFGGAFLEEGQSLRGWENFMCDLAGDPPFATAILDRLLDHHLKNAELYLEAVGDYIHLIQMGGDLGTQQGPQMRPETYYKLIQPRQKALWSRIHELAPHVAVFLHSCGAISDLIPGIIDAGCAVLNPVQISAVGMAPERLSAEFGDQICFWGGGCDTQTILPGASPEEVYRHTRRNVEIFKPGGRFVFCQVHNIQADVPPENIIAMFDAVRDAGSY